MMTSRQKRISPGDFLPFDCWGEVILFLWTPSDYFNLILAVPGLFDYLRGYQFKLKNIRMPCELLPSSGEAVCSNLMFGRVAGVTQSIITYLRKNDCNSVDELLQKIMNRFPCQNRLSFILIRRFMKREDYDTRIPSTWVQNVTVRQSSEMLKSFINLRSIELVLSELERLSISQLFPNVQEVRLFRYGSVEMNNTYRGLSLRNVQIDGTFVVRGDLDCRFEICFPNLQTLRLFGWKLVHPFQSATKKELKFVDMCQSLTCNPVNFTFSDFVALEYLKIDPLLWKCVGCPPLLEYLELTDRVEVADSMKPTPRDRVDYSRNDLYRHFFSDFRLDLIAFQDGHTPVIKDIESVKSVKVCGGEYAKVTLQNLQNCEKIEIEDLRGDGFAVDIINVPNLKTLSSVIADVTLGANVGMNLERFDFFMGNGMRGFGFPDSYEKFKKNLRVVQCRNDDSYRGSDNLSFCGFENLRKVDLLRAFHERVVIVRKCPHLHTLKVRPSTKGMSVGGLAGLEKLVMGFDSDVQTGVQERTLKDMVHQLIGNGKVIGSFKSSSKSNPVLSEMDGMISICKKVKIANFESFELDGDNVKDSILTELHLHGGRNEEGSGKAKISLKNIKSLGDVYCGYNPFSTLEIRNCKSLHRVTVSASNFLSVNTWKKLKEFPSNDTRFELKDLPLCDELHISGAFMFPNRFKIVNCQIKKLTLSSEVIGFVIDGKTNFQFLQSLQLNSSGFEDDRTRPVIQWLKDVKGLKKIRISSKKLGNIAWFGRIHGMDMDFVSVFFGKSNDRFCLGAYILMANKAREPEERDYEDFFDVGPISDDGRYRRRFVPIVVTT